MMSEKVITLENEKTIGLDSLDEVRELLKENHLNWMVIIYQTEGEVKQRCWSSNLTPTQSLTIQGALMSVRDYISAIGEEDE